MIFAELVGLCISLLALWIVGLGMCTILQLHRQYVRRSWDLLTRVSRFLGRQLSRFLQWIWRNYKTEVVWFFIGTMTTFATLWQCGHLK